MCELFSDCPPLKKDGSKWVEPDLSKKTKQDGVPFFALPWVKSKNRSYSFRSKTDREMMKE